MGYAYTGFKLPRLVPHYHRRVSNVSEALQNITYVLVIVFIGVLIAGVVGYGPMTSMFHPSVTAVGPTQVKLQFLYPDHFDPGVTHDAPSISVYQLKDGQYIYLGAPSAGELTVQMTKEMAGKLYLVVAPAAGHYLYVTDIISKNQYITGYEWKDITGDGKEDFVFAADLSSIPPPTGNQPPIANINIFQVDYEGFTATGTGLNSPANITGLTTEKDVWIYWEITFSDNAKAAKLVQLYVSSDVWNPSKCEVKELDTGIGNFQAEKLKADDVGKRWKADLGFPFDGYKQDKYFVWMETTKTGSLKVKVYARVHVNMASGDAFNLTLNAVFLSPTGSLKTLSDTVQLSYA